MSEIFVVTGKIQTKRLASLLKSAYINEGTADKEVIFEELHAALLQSRPPFELTRQKFNAAYEIANESTGVNDSTSSKMVDQTKPPDKSGAPNDTKLKEKVPPVTPKELDAFITGLLKDSGEEMT